jgi:hypothetical protein
MKNLKNKIMEATFDTELKQLHFFDTKNTMVSKNCNSKKQAIDFLKNYPSHKILRVARMGYVKAFLFLKF